MTNLFDSTNATEGEPLEIVVGDFAQWKRSDIASSYPTSDGYTAQYVFRILGGNKQEFTVSQDAGSTDDFYLFKIASSASALYESGHYHWQLEVTQTSSSNRIVVATGDIDLIPDLDNQSADPRSHAEKILEKIETLLMGKADSDAASYSIAGRSLTKLSFSELLDARNFYKSEVVKEKRERDAKAGKKTGSTIQVRF